MQLIKIIFTCACIVLSRPNCRSDMQYKLLAELYKQRSINEAKPRVDALAWSPVSDRCAVARDDRRVALYDDSGEEYDNFSTRSIVPESEEYIITDLAFSPDGTHLAIGQSDFSVFVYRIGSERKAKKSIVNKVLFQSAITCLIWPTCSPDKVVVGCQDGEVRLVCLKTNNATILYKEKSSVTALCDSERYPNYVAAAHLDGSIRLEKVFSGNSGNAQVSTPSLTNVIATNVRLGPVERIAWSANGIIATNASLIATVYDPISGLATQEINLAHLRDYDLEEEEISAVSCTKQGDLLALASNEHLRFFKHSIEKGSFVLVSTQVVNNLGLVRGLTFEPKGSRKLLVNCCSGKAYLLEAALERLLYRGNFEFRYASPSEVIVKFPSGKGFQVRSIYEQAIQKLDIYKDRFVVARTKETLLISDSEAKTVSEIVWPLPPSSIESFIFEYPGLCLVKAAGELVVVEYGKDDPVCNCKTEYVTLNLLSVLPVIARIAFLVDWRTISVYDWRRKFQVETVTHSIDVVWLELSPVKGHHLLFLDKRKRLVLCNMLKGWRRTLAKGVSFAQWVPCAEVIVAQSHDNLCVWYSVDLPEQSTSETIDNGQILSVSRSENGDSIVEVDKGAQTAYYKLDSSLISLAGDALGNSESSCWKTAELLRTMPSTPETEDRWKRLCEEALESENLVVAEESLAAIGDVTRARYIHNIIDMARKLSAANNSGHESTRHFRVRAKLAIFHGDYREAEKIYLKHGATAEAIKMYQDIHDWNSAIKVGEKKNYPDLSMLKRNYVSWLLETDQFAEAAEQRLQDGEQIEAVELFLKGQRPAKAANLFLGKFPELLQQSALAIKTAQLLEEKNLHEKAGLLYEKLGKNDEALAAYEKGNCITNALTLARKYQPESKIKILEAALSRQNRT